MKLLLSRVLMASVAVPLLLVLGPLSAVKAQSVYAVKPIAEKKLQILPTGPLYWRVETMPTTALAQAAASDHWNPDTVKVEPTPVLTADVAGKTWLFTLGPPGGSTPNGTKVAEIGPVPVLSVPEYLLRINHGSGPPGSTTPTHTHPGSEAFFVVEGRLGQRTGHGTAYVEAGSTMNGHGADMPMEIFNGGTSDLSALIMFVVDATKPFSTPAELH